MPIYDYRCKSCNNTYQKIVSYEKRNEASCPECNSKEKVQIFKVSSTGPINSSCSSTSRFG